MGDLDLDGTIELAVGAPGDDGSPGVGPVTGAVYILFLTPSGAYTGPTTSSSPTTAPPSAAACRSTATASLGARSPNSTTSTRTARSISRYL
eukprot:2298783-Prymnesium_polylepis.1